MSDKLNISTKMGRLVSGSVTNGATKDSKGRPLVDRQGNPRTSYSIGVAFRKDDPEWLAEKQKILEFAAKEWPSYHSNPNFSSKIKDGDSAELNTKGRKNCDNEGWPGHDVVFFSTGYPPQCFALENGAYEPINGERIAKGDYVMVSGTVKSNNNQEKPGLYVSHNMVCFLSKGKPINSGPTAEQAFGAPPAAPTPVTPENGPQPPAPAAPPSPGVQPHNEFLSGAPAAPPAGPPKRNLNGQAFTVEQLLASGWTQEQIESLPLA